MVSVKVFIVFVDVPSLFSYDYFIFSSFVIGIYFVHPMLLVVLVILAALLVVSLLVVMFAALLNFLEIQGFFIFVLGWFLPVFLL